MEIFALHFLKNEGFHVWQFISYMFLHGSIGHIVFNMFALASFGIPLVLTWGTRRFLIFYFVTGIGAAIVYSAVNYFQFAGVYSELAAAGFTPENIQVLLNTFKADPALISKLPQETIESAIGIYHSRAIGASGAVYGIVSPPPRGTA